MAWSNAIKIRMKRTHIMRLQKADKFLIVQNQTTKVVNFK